MADIIMLLSGILFLVLFAFLVFVFSIFVASAFFERKYRNFKPRASIVIPAYNEEKNIKECLDSVFMSDYDVGKLEVIVVDDGSNDNTVKIARRYKGVKALRQKHLGKVEALNLGIKKASNEFIITIDADTILDRDCIAELLKPFADENTGATTGNNNVKNNNTLIAAFQNVEYHFNNLIRNSFSKVFENSIWFFGSLACYRKTALERIRYFKADTLAEDTDIALELRKAGYKIINTAKAIGYTTVPDSVKGLYRQRARWWVGTLQSMAKNKKILSMKASPSILFLFVNQFWWSFYAFLSLPLILYQINYWLPHNSGSIFAVLSYLFRWFSLLGPIYVLYKIPEWGISLYSVFGVLSGIVSTIMIAAALKMFKDRNVLKSIFATFFYFPYTIVLNTIILVSLLNYGLWRKESYIK